VIYTGVGAGAATAPATAAGSIWAIALGVTLATANAPANVIRFNTIAPAPLDRRAATLDHSNPRSSKPRRSFSTDRSRKRRIACKVAHNIDKNREPHDNL
jgi:hypothetical protein